MNIFDKIIELNVKGKVNTQIAEELNITIKLVQSTINRLGYKANKHRIIEETEELQQFIIGSLLGDGSFTNDSRFSIAHSITQKNYCLWKHSILAKYDLAGKFSINTIYNNRYKSGYIEEARFKSLKHPMFKKIRDINYINNRKILLDNDILNIEPLGLAIWYMDDGYVTNDSLQICSERFDLQTVQKLANLLLTKFKIDTTINSRKEIYILKSSKNIFINLIKPYIIDDLKYKLISYKDR